MCDLFYKKKCYKFKWKAINITRNVNYYQLETDVAKN